MNLTLRQKIGQMFLIGFEGSDEKDPSVQKVLQHIQDQELGGVLFFKRNIRDEKSLQMLTQKMREASSKLLPTLISLDQEGGKVQRLSNQKGMVDDRGGAASFRNFLSAEEVVATYPSEEKAFEYYSDMAQYVKSFGFNYNFGPIVDLNPKSRPFCKVIGELGRSYGDSSEKVVPFARAFIRAHHKYKILTSLKHFPGHGRVLGDSHEGLVETTSTFTHEEILPFVTLIREGFADSIMTANIMNKQLDHEFPATLSPKILQVLLREELKFQGVVVADDLCMGALAQNYSFQKRILCAIKAGVDVMIVSNNPLASPFGKPENFSLPQLIDTVEKALEHGFLSEHYINTAWSRIQKFKSVV